MKTCFSTSPLNPLLHLLFFAVFPLFLSSFASSVVVISDSGKPSGPHRLHVETRRREPESYHVRTLASILGSKEAARNALVYSYKTAVSGFSAKLTLKQVAEISRSFPEVEQIIQRDEAIPSDGVRTIEATFDKFGVPEQCDLVSVKSNILLKDSRTTEGCIQEYSSSSCPADLHSVLPFFKTQ